MSRIEGQSFCRICAGACGVRVVAENGRIVEVKGDKDHPMTQGYACLKGLKVELENGPGRILRPQKRQPDGTFREIGVEQAMDEIAERLAAIIERHGPDAIASYRGTPNYYHCAAYHMLPAWMEALGSKSFYSSLTLDQSAKIIATQRLGTWSGGRPRLEDTDLWMLAGSNPLLSLSFGLGVYPSHPLNQLRAARANGMKLVVIDPRRSETAAFADLHLQPLPGEDPTIASGLLHLILRNGWEDREFCDRWVVGLEDLRRAVAPFTPDYVAARAGVAQADLETAAQMFGTASRYGRIRTGTGPNMSARSNLAEHLYDCMNVICGRFSREGDEVDVQPLVAPATPRAEAISPTRPWETSHKNRAGYGTIMGEMVTGCLSDEILNPGPGQVRGMMVLAGNPVAAMPDTARTIEAFSDLDLLVAVDPYFNATSRLAHYVIPPITQYEHAELSNFFMGAFAKPFAQYAPALVPVPEGSEVVQDWYPLWATAKRLGRPIRFAGVDLDMETEPTPDQLLEMLVPNSQISFAELKSHPAGVILDIPPTLVGPASEGATGRFEVAAPDIVAEIAEVLAEGAAQRAQAGYAFRLSSRRMRNVMNSACQDLPSVRRTTPYNPAYMNPEDLAALGLVTGDRVELVSSVGTIEALVAADDHLRRGVVSMAHSWAADNPDQKSQEWRGSCTNFLVSPDEHREPINAMPRFSAIPVNVRPIHAPAAQHTGVEIPA